MSEIKLALDLSNNSDFDDLSVELWLDDTKFFDQPISKGTHKVIHTFEEDENHHQFKIVLKDKKESHTTVDQNGTILDDAIIDVKNIFFDNINVDNMMIDLAKYSHDTNGTQDTKDHKFYGHLGCNGTVSLDFYLPFYMWLLENM